MDEELKNYLDKKFEGIDAHLLALASQLVEKMRESQAERDSRLTEILMHVVSR